MSALQTKETAIIPHTGVDFSGLDGYLVKENAGAMALNDSATVPARGVIMEGNAAARDSAIGILGSLGGTVRLKSSGVITKFALVQQAADGTVTIDAGSGARVLIGVAIEAAASGDLFEVALISPRIAS